MVTASTAKNLIEAHIRTTTPVEVPITQAIGAYLASHIFAPIDIPSFDNSAMDGYGFRFADLEKYDSFQVIGEVPAGKTTDFSLAAGEAIRIFTGARVPNGVDTIVIQEKVTRNGDTITFDKAEVKYGAHIRKKGEQTEKGSLAIHENTPISAGTISFLASLGIDKVTVFSKPRIGLLYTGDELVELGTPLEEGKIYNSNSYTLQAALAEIHQELAVVEHIADTQEATETAIRKALQEVDILLLSGGISTGDYDFVRSALQNIGVKEVFYKVQQKPGKPLYFGTLGDKRIFALPGNPASVFTSFHIYVKPFILGCYGRNNFQSEMDYAFITHDLEKKKAEITFYMKGYVDKMKVMALPSQESYKLDSLPVCNCFIEFPANETKITNGQKVKIWRI